MYTTPERRALRPVNTSNQPSPNSSSSPSSSTSPSLSKSTLSPSPSNKENVHPSSSSPSTSRRRRHVMRLGELMASVAMTPIKEREEEEGLGEAIVEVGAMGEEGRLTRQQEQEEEELLHYQAMMEQEHITTAMDREEVDEVTAEDEQESDQYDSDGFHSADESDFQWAGGESPADKRRSFRLIHQQQPDAVVEDDDLMQREVEDEAQPLEQQPQPEEEQEEQTTDEEEQQLEPSHEPQEDDPPPVNDRANPSLDTDSNPSTPQPKRLMIKDEDSTVSPLPSLLSPLPPAHPPTPSPSPTCSHCHSLFQSLQHYQSECDQLQSRVEEVTEEGSRLYEEYEKKSVRMREMAMQQQQREEDEQQRQVKDDADYRSLYFAYVQLEQQYKALQQQTPQPQVEQVEAEAEVEEDYTSIVEEKRTPSPVVEQVASDSVVDGEAERLRAENVWLREELRVREVEGGKVEGLERKYRAVLAMYTAQVSTLKEVSKVLKEMEEVEEEQGKLDVEWEERLSEERRVVEGVREQLRKVKVEGQGLERERDEMREALSEVRDTMEYVQAEKMANEEELHDLKQTLQALQQQHDAAAAEHSALLAVQRSTDQQLTSVKDELVGVKLVSRQLRSAFGAAKMTLDEMWEGSEHLTQQLMDSVTQLEQLRGDSLAREAQLAHELLTVIEQRSELEQRLRTSEDSRVQCETRLSSSEERVQSLTLAMTALTSSSPSPSITSQPSSDLLHLQSKHTTLTLQHKSLTNQLHSIQAELAATSHTHDRLRTDLRAEREMRQRAEGGLRVTEGEVRRWKEAVLTWEGKWEGVEGVRKERAHEKEEVEKKLREKDVHIQRLSKTVREMNRHIEGEGAERVKKLQLTIGQLRQVIGVVVGLLKREGYRGDVEVQRVLAVLEMIVKGDERERTGEVVVSASG